MSQTDDNQGESSVQGVILPAGEPLASPEVLVEALANDWGLPPDEWAEKEGGLVLLSDELCIRVRHFAAPYALPPLRSAARLAWWWSEAERAVLDHPSHLLLSVEWPGGSPVECFLAFTQAAGAVLQVTGATGIFLPLQQLLLPGGFFLETAREAGDDRFPLELWIYVGLGKAADGHFGYTSGLKTFGYPELEVTGSQQPLPEIHGLLCNVAHYVLAAGVKLEEGERLSLTGVESVRVRRRPGIHLDGEVLWLAF